MSDFASAAMMRLIVAGLARQGFSDLDGPHRRGPRPRGPHVPLSMKREALGDIFARHGPLALLRIGEALPDLGDEAMLAAMDEAQDPQTAIARWQRLERYVHSKHRTDIVSAGEGHMTLRHLSMVGAPPKRQEDLLIFGVLIGLIEWVGAVGVCARPVGDLDWSYAEAWRAVPDTEDVSTWLVEWTGLSRRPCAAEASGTTLPDLVRTDLARRWTVAEAARTLGFSTRSLQRSLAGKGTTFTKVVGDARLAAALKMLGETNRTIGEIGYICGFADQAHFTRTLRAAMAVTPKVARDDLALARIEGRL